MNLLGKAQDKEFWAEVRKKECYESVLRRLKREYGKLVEEGPLKSHKYSEFKLFWTTGERKTYEKSHTKFRQRMEGAAILALIYPENQEYLDDLMDTIYAVCDEYTWCWPAHQGSLEINNNCHIDLVASMTASQLAEIYTLLYDRLEPLIKNRIVAEINRRVIEPFLATEYYDWWEKNDSNWSAVCIGGVARAMMLIRPEGMTPDFIARVRESLDSYLSGFDAKGMCLEGIGYWRYGFGHFVMCTEMLRRFTDGEIDYFKLDKVRFIASSYQKCFLSGEIGLSFSDGGGPMRYPVYLLHFLKNEYPDDVLVYDSIYSSWDCMAFRSYTWYDDDIASSTAPDDTSFEFYTDDAEWFIKRTATYGFAGKGGHNGEHHNHNDVGSFIFAKEGRHVFTDPGGGLYSRQYFGEERYTYLEASSKGHSVPIVDGTYQSAGKSFAASDASYENGVFSIDIAGAYECEGLYSIKRSFSFTDDRVTLTDTFDCEDGKKLVQRIVTRFAPEKISDGNIKVDCGGVLYNPDVCVAEISSENDSRGNPLYIIDFVLGNGVKSSTVTLY